MSSGDIFRQKMKCEVLNVNQRRHITSYTLHSCLSLFCSLGDLNSGYVSDGCWGRRLSFQNKSLILLISSRAANLLGLTHLTVLACAETAVRGRLSNYRGLDSITWETIKTLGVPTNGLPNGGRSG